MADRVHPRDSPPSVHGTDDTSSVTSETTLKPAALESEKPVPQPGTYVIHIPKDQVYRVPPPENARRYENLARRGSRKSPCCLCLCWLIGLLVIFVVLLGIAAGILYLVFKPRAPSYSVDAIEISGLNLTAATDSSALKFSPVFNVTVRADNPNDKIGIYYRSGSSVEIYYLEVKLSNGVLPVFYQPTNNLTVFPTVLKGSGIELTSMMKSSMMLAQSRGDVPLGLKIRAPVRIKVGSVTMWTMTVKVDCDIKVDKLTENAKIVSKACGYGVNPW